VAATSRRTLFVFQQSSSASVGGSFVKHQVARLAACAGNFAVIRVCRPPQPGTSMKRMSGKTNTSNGPLDKSIEKNVGTACRQKRSSEYLNGSVTARSVPVTTTSQGLRAQERSWNSDSLIRHVSTSGEVPPEYSSHTIDRIPAGMRRSRVHSPALPRSSCWSDVSLDLPP